jgi:hypothetical protein
VSNARSLAVQYDRQGLFILGLKVTGTFGTPLEKPEEIRRGRVRPPNVSSEVPVTSPIGE